MTAEKRKSVMPIYLIGFLWIIWAVVGPLYRPVHYVVLILLSLIVFFAGKMIWPDTDGEGNAEPVTQGQEEDGQEEPPLGPDSAEIDALIQERERAVSEMRRLNQSIQDPKISDQISHLEITTNQIISAVVEKPAKLPQLRKFMNYYLPTTLKLLNAYDRLDSTGVSGTNIDGSKGKIEEMMDKICVAFDRQLDSLYGEEAMDISTDITVLENMLAQEGLAGLNINDFAPDAKK